MEFVIFGICVICLSIDISFFIEELKDKFDSLETAQASILWLAWPVLAISAWIVTAILKWSEE